MSYAEITNYELRNTKYEVAPRREIVSRISYLVFVVFFSLSTFNFPLSTPVSAQIPVPTQEDVPFFGEGSEDAMAQDTTKQKRPKKPLESYHFDFEQRAELNSVWTVSTHTNHLHFIEADTLQADFQIQYPFMKEGVGSAYLGNLGAPSMRLDYFERPHLHHHDHTFANAWNEYIRTPENMPFHNVKKPFTQLSYAWAGQKARQEEELRVVHAQNISPSTGFNIDYRSLGTRGIYSWQATRDKTFSIGFQHTGKRYTIHAGYIHNSIFNQENGGVVRDNDIIVDINTYEMAANIPVAMSDPTNTIKSNTYFLIQSYGIPLRRVREGDFTIADRPAVFVGHSITYSRWVRKYEDTYDGTLPSRQANNDIPMTSYYDNWYISPTASRDSIFEGNLSNRVFVQLQPWNRAGVIGTIDAGVGADVLWHYMFSPDQFLTGAKKTAERETAYYVYAGIDGHIKQYFDWGAAFEFHPFGHHKGNIEAEAEVEARVFAKGRPISLFGHFHFNSCAPSHWETEYYSNHFRWSNDFSKQNEMRFDVGLKIPHIGLEASVSQSVMGNKIFYGTDFVPHQATDAVSVTGVYIREDVRIPVKRSAFNFNHRVMLQWSSDQRVVPVPLAAAYVSYSFEFNVVRDVLRLQFGVDVRYNTKYYAPGYNPGTAQFYNQREKELGDYVWADLFVTAKWKRMRILIKMEHLNDNWFGRNYFTTLHYPQNRRILKVGVSWNFYD